MIKNGSPQDQCDADGGNFGFDCYEKATNHNAMDMKLDGGKVVNYCALLFLVDGNGPVTGSNQCDLTNSHWQSNIATTLEATYVIGSGNLVERFEYPNPNSCATNIEVYDDDGAGGWVLHSGSDVTWTQVSSGAVNEIDVTGIWTDPALDSGGLTLS